MAVEETFDLIIIGGGPGGYVAAIRAAQLGLRPALVEKRETLGGTCLNEGCVPAKALLESSEWFQRAKEGMAHHGVVTGPVTLDLDGMLARKEKVVAELTRGVDLLMKKNKVVRFLGSGRILSPIRVEVTPMQAGEVQTLTAPHILIATGSEPIALPGVPFDGSRVIHSTHGLSLPKVPDHLVIIGAGVIGLELGSVWRRLGAKVTIVEMLPHLLGGMDIQAGKTAQRIFTKQGLVFHMATRVEGVKSTPEGVTVTARPPAGDPFTLEADHVMVAVGRKPYTEGLGLDQTGVVVDERGRIQVNERFQTSVPSIRAIGDVIAGPMLAHKASEEASAAVEWMAGLPGEVSYDAIPSIVYTWPEIAWVGKGEDQLKAENREYKSGVFPFLANARAKTMAATDGMVKVLADPHTDTLLGVLILGPGASEMIGEAALAIEFGASAEDLGLAVHGHPTLSEALKEAALGVHNRAIHI